ncbi:MAG: type IV toxin-antitoxin system AbiEi family antitoxin [Bryobacteraceae bacterium]
MNRPSTLAHFVDSLQERGRYTFSREEALSALGVTPVALKRAAERLKAKRRLAAPRRGFYTIVPLEYRQSGSLPAASFIDQLMHYHEVPYYVGLLSAAEIHGAAHQRPQQFQVIASKQLRPVVIGRNRIQFFLKKDLERTPVQVVKTASGQIRVSSPESTALDLVRFQDRVGGLDHVATVLLELAEKMDPARLVAAAQREPEIASVQRLGYILEFIGKEQVVRKVANWVDHRDPKIVPLITGEPASGSARDSRWRILRNHDLETDEL